MKDHEVRELVNELTDTATKYGHMQQLRERIKGVLADKVDQLRARVAELEKDAARLDWIEAVERRLTYVQCVWFEKNCTCR